MSEYDLVCDVCKKPLEPGDGIVSWTSDGTTERGFLLTHADCVPETATQRAEVLRLTGPNDYLRFVSDRFGQVIPEPEPLRAIVWALAPFVLRPDTGVEMDILRAASFGARPGVKPGTNPPPSAIPKKNVEVEAGK